LGALTRFVDDARLKLDNNTAERQLRRVAVGRKNWLLAGSDDGAEPACVLYSLLAWCKLHGLTPDRRQLFLPVDDNYSCRLPPGSSSIVPQFLIS